MKPPRPSTPVRLTGGLHRRHILFGIAAVIAQAGFWRSPLSHAQLSARDAVPAALSPEALAFLTFSKRITGHIDLNPTTATRIEAALRRDYPDFTAQFAQFAPLVERGQPPDALLAAATEAGLRDLVLAIVAAWYTGTVGHGRDAVVVSYAESLMYRPVADAQTVPTYCNFGPLWWVKAPPPVRVAAPTTVSLSKLPSTTTTASLQPTTRQR